MLYRLKREHYQRQAEAIDSMLSALRSMRDDASESEALIWSTRIELVEDLNRTIARLESKQKLSYMLADESKELS